MIPYYRKDGTIYENKEEFEKDYNNLEKRILKQEILPNGLFVSTIWLGIDMSYPYRGTPLIFETLVFPEKGAITPIDMRRYSTEQEALKGHTSLIEKWKEVK